MRCEDTGARAFWQLLGLTVVTLTCAGLIAASLPAALGLWLSDAAAQQPVRLFGVTALSVFALVILHCSVRALRRSGRATRRLHRDLAARRRPASEAVAALAAEVGVHDVVVVEDPAPFALTYGVRRPRVSVSTGLIEALSREELGAVLAHEQAHVEGRDPLRMLLAAVVTPTRFSLPALSALRARFVIGRELAADRRAMERYGRRALAGALLKVIDVPHAGAAAMAEPLALGARLTQLETGTQDGLPRVDRFHAALSLVGIALLAWGAVITSALTHAVCC